MFQYCIIQSIHQIKNVLHCNLFLYCSREKGSDNYTTIYISFCHKLYNEIGDWRIAESN